MKNNFSLITFLQSRALITAARTRDQLGASWCNICLFFVILRNICGYLLSRYRLSLSPIFTKDTKTDIRLLFVLLRQRYAKNGLMRQIFHKRLFWADS